MDHTTRRQWQDWVTRESGGSAARIGAATDATIAAITRGEFTDEAAAARATRITVSADSTLAKPANSTPAIPADTDAAARRELLARVRTRRASVSAFVQDQRPPDHDPPDHGQHGQ